MQLFTLREILFLKILIKYKDILVLNLFSIITPNKYLFSKIIVTKISFEIWYTCRLIFLIDNYRISLCYLTMLFNINCVFFVIIKNNTF